MVLLNGYPASVVDLLPVRVAFSAAIRGRPPLVPRHLSNVIDFVLPSRLPLLWLNLPVVIITRAVYPTVPGSVTRCIRLVPFAMILTLFTQTRTPILFIPFCVIVVPRAIILPSLLTPLVIAIFSVASSVPLLMLAVPCVVLLLPPPVRGITTILPVLVSAVNVSSLIPMVTIISMVRAANRARRRRNDNGSMLVARHKLSWRSLWGVMLLMVALDELLMRRRRPSLGGPQHGRCCRRSVLLSDPVVLEAG